MESNSQKESERLNDNENLQEYGDVNDNKQENYGNANGYKGEVILVNDQDKPNLISQDFIKTSQPLLMKEKPGESVMILEDDNFQLVNKTEDGLIINNEQESFESEFDMKNADWKASSEFQEKQFDDGETLGESHAKLTIEKISETAGFVPSGKIDQMRQEHDPKEKALRYLEESGVLRLFQNLAAGIVHDRPEKPLVYMIKTLERRKEENCEES